MDWENHWYKLTNSFQSLCQLYSHCWIINIGRSVECHKYVVVRLKSILIPWLLAESFIEVKVQCVNHGVTDCKYFGKVNSFIAQMINGTTFSRE
jgi:hypothetical protein